ncbi:uncharacterized protein LOC129753595 [Uranotaenia lowii]|uniref:uncharacterized protein LOC129753595 n=1 Tax=Uranotaenia lowii TaxID=190385 RepID=UPI0024783D4D|nr:uncharacterized protein LOC129753595 [Uranotaenia lowii]XP_055605415.1 uncharacterized protein LOC129753595 [Uranotaenia lowii]
MRAKAVVQDEMRKSIAAESDDDATRSSTGGGSSAATTTANQQHQQQHQRQLDLSLLRKPIFTAITGFLEAHKAYEAGTDEIRKLLTSECDILYECRVCRNIFRSLTNFISHKRVYCRKLFNAAQHFHFQNDGFLDQDLSTILQAEQDSQRKAKKVHVDILNKDLSSIIERLRRKQHKVSEELSATEFYNRANHKITQDDLNRQQHVLQLDRVPSSQAAVYQTIRASQNMRTELHELNSMTTVRNAVLDRDGLVQKTTPQTKSSKNTLPVICDPSNRYFKPIDETKDSIPPTTNNNNNNPQQQIHSCDDCNLQFDTEKTLKVHVEMKHTPSTYVYSCPYCSRTFMQPASVIRHLSNDHKKSLRRIKMIRDSILKKRIRADEVVVKGSSKDGSSGTNSTANSGRTSTTDANAPEERDEAAAMRAWMENLGHSVEGPMCSHCGKTFERKAVLTTHMQTCAQKTKLSEGAAATTTTAPSGRRSKVKEEVKIKQEPQEVANSDDSNSYDVPLAALQARINQDGVALVNGAVTVKPEELIALQESESCSRRKRKKPLIMLRNATDDISWEIEDCAVTDENVKNLSNVQIKKEIIEESESADLSAAQGKKGPRARKSRKADESTENVEKSVSERRDAAADEIVCRCSKKFSGLETYKRHLRLTHIRQRRFWCAVCEFKGYRKSDTVNHLIQEHGYKGGPEDASSLINVQPVEKFQCGPIDNTDEAIKSIIEAVSRNGTSDQTEPSILETSGDKSYLSSSSVPKNASETTPEASLRVPTPEPGSPKKRGRPRGLRDSICSLTPPEELCKKSKPSDCDDENLNATSKRPIRNRVKPVDKDFVYDLTDLLNKDEDLDDFALPALVLDKPIPELLPVTTKLVKPIESSRVQTTQAVTSEKRETKKESLRSHAAKIKTLLPPELVKGAAYAMAKRKVEHGLASFHRLPDYSQERSPHKWHLPLKRRITTIHDWPVVKKERKFGSITKPTADIQLKRKYTKRASTLIDNDLLSGLTNKDQRRAIPRRNSVGALPRMRLSVSSEILSRLKHPVAANVVPTPTSSSSSSIGESHNLDFRQFIEAHLKDHRAAMDQVNLNGTTAEDLSELKAEPKKRITMMQRLEENRNKRLQEQNGPMPSTSKTPTAGPSQMASAPSTSTHQPSPSSSTAPRMNVADMLHAKLKKFSSF